MKIVYTKKFLKLACFLPLEIQKKAAEKEIVFQQDPFAKSLKTHKLTGKMKGYHSFSVDYHYRIVFRFINKNKVLFLLIGNHSIYQ